MDLSTASLRDGSIPQAVCGAFFSGIRLQYYYTLSRLWKKKNWAFPLRERVMWDTLCPPKLMRIAIVAIAPAPLGLRQVNVLVLSAAAASNLDRAQKHRFAIIDE